MFKVEIRRVEAERKWAIEEVTSTGSIRQMGWNFGDAKRIGKLQCSDFVYTVNFSPMIGYYQLHGTTWWDDSEPSADTKEFHEKRLVVTMHMTASLLLVLAKELVLPLPVPLPDATNINTAFGLHKA